MLVAVHPDRSRARAAARSSCRPRSTARARARCRDLLLASAVPRYVWPGVDLTNTRAGMLLESLRLRARLARHRTWRSTRRSGASRRAGVVVERETGSGAHDFAARAYPHWVPELDRAVDRGTAFAARDATGATIGFGCHSVQPLRLDRPDGDRSRRCNTAASARRCSPRSAPTSTRAAARPARSRGSATCASTASAARRVSRVFHGRPARALKRVLSTGSRSATGERRLGAGRQRQEAATARRSRRPSSPGRA